MLTIRLQRTGKKNASSFRIVVAEKTAHVSKKFHEVLGAYNPSKKQFSLKNPERVQYWIGQHVELSPTVHNLLVTNGIIKGEKVKAFKTPKKEAEKEAPKEEAKTEAPVEEKAAEEAAPEAPAA